MLQGDGTNAVLAAGAALELDPQADFVRYRGGRSPRQQRLDKLYSYYTCDQYAARKVAWDGSRHVGEFERDTIALAGYVPPGFYVANSETLPITMRRPTTPYHLARVIVDRFTSLVFSQTRPPKVTVDADPDTDQLVQAMILDGKLWPMMTQVRSFGGATGSGVVGFKFINGRPLYEIFDPRWCTPVWLDRPNLVLKALDYSFPFVQEIKVGGKWEELELWHRRVIDTTSDTLYEPMPLDPEDENEPRWKVANRVPHGLGFCPVVWIQNTPKPTDIDGDPDCLGIYEMVEAIDRLSSQSDRALLANLDPTMVIASDANINGEVRKGSDNAVKVMKGDQVTYLEITAAGVAAAEAKIATYRSQALETAQCVLENPSSTTPRTATEVNRLYSGMLSKADILREQYGEGVRRLIHMGITAAKRSTIPSITDAGIRRGALSITPRADGSPQKLGPGPYRSSMKWPAYFPPSPADSQQSVSTAVLAKGGGLIDLETAVRYIADNFGIEDIKGMVDKLMKAASADQEKMESAALMGPKQVAKVVSGAPTDEGDGS